jgi:AcrR family transcriptional regulator
MDAGHALSDLTAHQPPGHLRPTRRERRRAETRQRLLMAALRLFRQRGFAATTVEQITEAADLGKGTFFNYFPSKEHILGALAEVQRGKIMAALEAVNRGRDVSGVLYRLYHELRQRPAQSQRLARSLLLAILSNHQVRRLVAHNLEQGRALLRQIFELGQQRNQVRRDCDAVELARLFQQSFLGTVLVWTLGPATPLRQSLDASFRVFWAGIAADALPSNGEKGAAGRKP